MDKIIIYDDFFSEIDLKKIKDFCDNNWLCKCMYSHNTDQTTDIPFWRKEYMEEHLFNTYLKEVIQEKLKKNINLKRIYAVGQTYGQNSNFHHDDITLNSYTFCFYINDILNQNHEGYFYVKVPNEKQIIAIEPVNNRGVLFPANYIHKGTGFNRFSNHLRVCIAWKFIDSSSSTK
jgi:hypothetical protein